MRGYMQGAIGALFAYGAAWWGTGQGAVTPIESGVRAAPVTDRGANVKGAPAPFIQASIETRAAPASAARSVAPLPQAGAAATARGPLPARAAQGVGADPLAGIAALPSDYAAASHLPPTSDSLRQLAEYRQLAESPAALVERVERFEPTSAQLAEFRRVAAQLFNARPAGAEGESPWATGGTRDGQGSLVHEAERSAERSAR